MKLAVYAITEWPRVPAATGVTGERLRLYREGPIAALAGDVRRAPRASPENLRRYDGTMRRLAASLPALLPVRFGTCVADAEELRFILRSRRRSLQRALHRVRHRVQMTTRVLAGPVETGAREPVDRPPAGGARARAPYSATREASLPAASHRAASGTRYLQERAEAAAGDRDVPGFAPVRAAVHRWVRDERIQRHGTMSSVYHLIPRAAAAVYHRAAARAASTAGLRIVVTGPWPPYAFAASW